MVDIPVSDNPRSQYMGKVASFTHVAVTFNMTKKSKLKGHGFGFLEKGIECTQSFISEFSEMVDLCCEYRLGEILAFGNLW
jgi:hypothetical protein